MSKRDRAQDTQSDETAMAVRRTVAMEAEEIINGPRRDAYGPVDESFRRIAEGWASILGVPVSVQQVAAMMVWLKVSREVGGNHHRDNLVDIVGYALLWERLEGL